MFVRILVGESASENIFTAGKRGFLHIEINDDESAYDDRKRKFQRGSFLYSGRRKVESGKRARLFV